MAFNFQAYRNPYVSTIAELLSRGEDAKAKALVDVANAQARAAEVRAQAYGGAVENVGKIVSGIPAQIQAGKDQAFKTAQQARLVQQQARDDAATTRLDQSRIAADRFRSNPNVTTVIPGQAGSLPDRMLPSFSPDTFVPDGAATSPDTLGGMLRKANVFGQQPSSQRLADTIPSASMSGVAAVAPRLAATMTGPDTTTTTNTSTRRDENGLELWDVEGYKQQEAAAGRGAEAQVTAKAMIESNDEMVKHYASAVALMQGDARRLSNQPDALLETGIDQLIERYRKNAVLPQEQLDAAAQQVDAIKQLPQEQQSLARRKFLRSVSGDKPNIVSGAPGEQFIDLDTREVVGSVAPKAVPVTPVGAAFDMKDASGRPGKYRQLSDGSVEYLGPPLDPQKPVGPRPNYTLLTSPSGEERQATDGAEVNALLAQGWKKTSGPSAPKQATGSQNRTFSFFNRAKQADEMLQELEESVSNLSLAGQVKLDYLPNFLKTQEGQSYTQAQRAFTEARLRKDSGATIKDKEYEKDKLIYFVQPGDTKDTIADKARSRASILASLAYESGPALAGFYGDDSSTLLQTYKDRSNAKNAPESPEARAKRLYDSLTGGK